MEIRNAGMLRDVLAQVPHNSEVVFRLNGGNPRGTLHVKTRIQVVIELEWKDEECSTGSTPT